MNYNCEECDYHCMHESHWVQHMSSKKHQNIDRQPRSDKVLEPKCKLCIKIFILICFIYSN